MLWRILHCWAVKSRQGNLNRGDIIKLSEYERKWLEILKQQRDFQREEANIFLIPIDCVKNNIQEIQDYKKYPGIMANVIFYEQGDGRGYYCVRCLVHKLVIFAYLTIFFSAPTKFSIHNDVIRLDAAYMPEPIEDIFIEYANDAKKV